MAKDYSNVAGVVGAVINTVDNVATEIGQEVSAAAPMWQSVVDQASSALESGAEYVADAAEDVYEALPEMDDVVETA